MYEIVTKDSNSDDEMNIRQNVDTGNELSAQEQIEEATGNEINENAIVETQSVINDEMNIRQNVDTSNELSAQEQMQSTDNDIGENTIASIESKLGPIFETTAQYESHPFAKIYPDATLFEADSLLEDIRVHGQYEAIIIYNGKVADGRTRKKVQDELGNPTLAREWLGNPEELLNYLFAKSQHRHLNSQQRAVIGFQFVQAERDLAKERRGMRTDLNKIVNAVQGRALDITAKKYGTNRVYLSYVEKIDDKADELLNYVKRNEIPITQAKLLAEKLDKREDRLEAIAEYKKGKQTMNTIIGDIKFKKDPAHKVGEENNGNLKDIIDIPAFILFQSLMSDKTMKVATEKIEQAAEILGITTKEMWYIPDVNEKDSKAILTLIKALVKKLKKIRRFSADGQELNNNC